MTSLIAAAFPTEAGAFHHKAWPSLSQRWGFLSDIENGQAHVFVGACWENVEENVVSFVQSCVRLHS